MKIQKVINIEDDAIKHSHVVKELKQYGIKEVFWARDAESGINEIESAIAAGQPYDLLVSDMHFEFYGENDRAAGEKTMKLLREKAIEIPVIICSSQNWNIPGAVANVFYNERRYWEDDLRRALDKLEH